MARHHPWPPQMKGAGSALDEMKRAWKIIDRQWAMLLEIKEVLNESTSTLREILLKFEVITNRIKPEHEIQAPTIPGNRL